MIAYIVKRLLLAIPTLLGISIVTFVIVNLAPGDPAQLQALAMEDPDTSERVYQELREYYGLDKPIHERYFNWLGRLVTLDFGNSMTQDTRPVIEKIGERLWPTMTLATISLVISLTLSVPIGMICAWRQNGWFDTVSSTILYALYSVPSYVMAVPLILIVGVQLDLLPFQGMRSDGFDELTAMGKAADTFKHYVLITFCFSFGSWAYYSRFVRQNMLEVLRQDYIRTARAKGQNEFRIVVRHAFSNTLIPMLTLLGLLLPQVISGSVILEVMFNWPGLGRLLFESMLARDYTTIMALNFIAAALVLLGILMADIGYAYVDPRVTYD